MTRGLTDVRRWGRRLLPAALAAVVLAGAAVYLSVVPREAGKEATAFRVGSLRIAEPFTLATEPGAKTAAGYMRIENGGSEGDRLLSATVEIAPSVLIQEAANIAGVTNVHAVEEGVDVPAGGTLQLRPGSYRLLFRGLDRQLNEGERFSGTLTFAKAGTVRVTYQVGPLVPSIGGPFALIDQDGKALSNADLLGKPYAIFFGYTHCPDVCPTTLFEMSAALAKLGADADRLRMVFVTVDPARDTPELLKEYLGAFDAHIVGLTGTVETIDAAAKAFHTFYKKVPGKNGDYSMDHSASVILMDAEGSFVGTISYRDDVDTRAEKLKRLVSATRS
jgi:protein SCO1